VRARSSSAALRRAAFSRSRSPMRPRWWDSVTWTSEHSFRRIALAGSSQDGSSGEKIAATATDRAPPRRICRAAWRIPAPSNGMIGWPSYSSPPWSINTSLRTSSARSEGQSQKGGSDPLAGSPMRTAATRVRSRRCRTALTKWVVPITTPSTAQLISGRPASAVSASTMPPRNIRCGRRLDRMHDPPILEQHGVRIGTADIDADPSR